MRKQKLHLSKRHSHKHLQEPNEKEKVRSNKEVDRKLEHKVLVAEITREQGCKGYCEQKEQSVNVVNDVPNELNRSVNWRKIIERQSENAAEEKEVEERQGIK